MSTRPPTNKVRIVTLGCAKNEVDSEEIAGVLTEAGYSIDGASKKTDVTVINTCGFLEAAKEESVKAIRDAVREKKAGRTGKVIVAGCLAQRLGAELAKLAPGADAYVGVGQMGRFGEIVGRLEGRLTPLSVVQSTSKALAGPHFVRDDEVEAGDSLRSTPGRSPESGARSPQSQRGPIIDIEPPHHRWAEVATRARSGRPWSAYLKVSEGCDHKCTFCTIPSFRGGHQSKPLERVVEEARHLVRMGTREINLIAQDVTQYGYDLYREFTLPKLLRELNAVDGIDWIRILYFYPNRLTDEVIEAMATLPKVLPYIDIPLQHAHADTLRRMKRPWDGERYLRLFEKLRAAMPECAIRTTFIVGFPGETDAEFSYLLEFMQQANLDRVGAFIFSREPGTPSYEMEGQVPFRLKRQRYDALMRMQQGISLSVNQSWIGRRLPVLVEDVFEGGGVGRSQRDAPEIDGLVYVRGEVSPGSIVEVEIEDAEHYDLHGSVMGAADAPVRVPLRIVGPKAPL